MDRARLVVGIVALLVLAGCTRSLEFTYKPSATPVKAFQKAGGMAIGVAKFEDKRSWVDTSDEKGQSYIAQQGPWKFGLTHDGKEFVPVNDLIQSLFVTELRQAGFQAKPLPGLPTRAQLRQVGQQAGTQYVLGGEIHVFEFVNEEKAFTVTSRRSVTLAVTVVQVQDGRPIIDSNYNELNREGEGMGVMHTTNVDKLMHGPFKIVIQKVIGELAQKLEVAQEDITVRFVAYAR